MAFENIKQAYHSAIALFKAGHKIEAIKVFCTGAWRGKHVQVRQEVKLNILDSEGNSAGIKTVKSNLKVGKNALTVEQKNISDRTVKEIKTNPYLADVSDVEYGETVTQTSVIPKHARIHKQDETWDGVSTTVQLSPTLKPFEHSSGGTADINGEELLWLLKEEGNEAFEAELLAYPLLGQLLNAGDFLEKKGVLTGNTKKSLEKIMSVKLADAAIANKVMDLTYDAHSLDEFKKSLEKNIDDESLNSVAREYVKSNFTRFDPSKKYSEMQLAVIENEIDDFMCHINQDALSTQLQKNMQDEADSAEITWDDLVLSKTDANQKFKGVTAKEANAQEGINSRRKRK